MSEHEIERIDGDTVVDKRDCAFSGLTVYTLKDEDGNYRDVDKHGNEVTAFSLSSPSDSIRGCDYVQCDPNGETVVLSSETNGIVDYAKELMAVLPTGEVVAALAFESVIWPHHNDEYTDYRQTPLKSVFENYVSPKDTTMSIKENRYYNHKSGEEYAHTQGKMKHIDVDDIKSRNIHEVVKNFATLLKNGEITLNVPVFMPSNYKIITHEKYTQAIGDMVEAEYTV